MNVNSRLWLAWLLLVFNIEDVIPGAEATRVNGFPKSVSVQACGEALNHVIKLVCAGIYRRKRSLFLPGEYGLSEPNSIASSSDFTSSLEPSDVEDLITLFGEDLPLEDYRPLAFLLRHNALFIDEDPSGTEQQRTQPDQQVSPFYTRSRYLRLRRHEHTGASYECCTRKCSYTVLKSYCGTTQVASK